MRRLGFGVFMLALSVLFANLGFWQLDRMAEKDALARAVETRAGLEAVPLPPTSEWSRLEPAALDFLPFLVRGRFLVQGTVPVFTNLPEPIGEAGGAGYWLMVPFEIEGGGTIFLNRGFVPEDRLGAFRPDPGTPQGTVELTGIARRPERSGPFTPAPDTERGTEWVRDPSRLAALAGTIPLPVAPIYLDLPTQGPGILPQAGETVTTVSSRHLEYALTWFAFAALAPVMLAIWLVRQRRSSAQPP